MFRVKRNVEKSYPLGQVEIGQAFTYGDSTYIKINPGMWEDILKAESNGNVYDWCIACTDGRLISFGKNLPVTQVSNVEIELTEV